MSKECCCNKCYKRNYCAGSNWFSDMCDKDRDECTHKKVNQSISVIKDVGDLNDKRKSE